MRRRLLVACVPAAWLATMAWLLGPAATRFPAPPTAATQWSSWWEANDPLDAVCALVRLGCLAVGLGLLLLVVAGVAARIAGARVWSRRIAAISPSVVSTFVAAIVMSTSPSAGAETLPVPFAAPVGPGEGATMTVIDTASPRTTPPTSTPASTTPTTTTPRTTTPPVSTVPATPPAPTTESDMPTMTTMPTMPTMPATTAPAPGTSVVVAPGEHFWSIAERQVGRQLGRAPSEAEVAGYWRRLVAANSHRLVEPGNPDLLEVGQVILLP